MTQDTQPLIEMTVLTENDPDIVRMVCKIAEHMTGQGGSLVVTKDHSGNNFLAGYHFAQEEPGSEMAGGAAYGIAPSIAGALADVVEQVGLDQRTGPTITMTAAQVLSSDPQDDYGQILSQFLATPEVQEYLQSKARQLLSNPLLAVHQDRPRWEAFAVVEPGEQVRGGR